MVKAKRAPFEIGGEQIPAGEERSVDLSLPPLYTHSPLAMPVQVLHGRQDGPVLFVSGAVHGDELNGVEIIHRLLRHSALRKLRGTLLAVPVVNVYGMIQHTRYLPDRRDLNRSFPGSERGSLAGRVANTFMTEIVAKSTHGIDLHTGANHRENLPQIRADLDDEQTLTLARAFGVPVLLNSDLRDGSLRQSAREHGVRMLVYESGEALRFDELSIRAGVRGVLNVMRSLGMIAARTPRKKALAEPTVARSSAWVRATASGVLRTAAALGERVGKGQLLCRISDPFGENEESIVSPVSGIVIGKINIPLVHEGEALYHIARFSDSLGVAQHVDEFSNENTDSLDPSVDFPVI